ncbi:hypothetical protein QE250_12195 [Chromatiaceae bacterium AAb-1]|nr:hypothetical protein [Chromatiaceae bacterium AAb-1]
MSVSISEMVEQTNTFEAQQLKAFQEFIDASKELKGALKTEQQKARQNYHQMEAQLADLEKPVSANGKLPIEILESDTLYMQALESVNVLSPDLNQPKMSVQYMDAFQQQVEKDMKQREQDDE